MTKLKKDLPLLVFTSKKAGLNFFPFGDGSAFILGEYQGENQEDSFCYGIDIPVKDDAKWRFWKMYDGQLPRL